MRLRIKSVFRTSYLLLLIKLSHLSNISSQTNIAAGFMFNNNRSHDL